MIALSMLFAVIALPQQPTAQADTATYINSRLDLRLSYPKTWQVSTNKKGETRVLVPVEGSSEKALLEIFPVSFRSDASVWQLSQVGVNKTMKREIDRQWQEELL